MDSSQKVMELMNVELKKTILEKTSLRQAVRNFIQDDLPAVPTVQLIEPQKHCVTDPSKDILNVKKEILKDVNLASLFQGHVPPVWSGNDFTLFNSDIQSTFLGSGSHGFAQLALVRTTQELVVLKVAYKKNFQAVYFES